MNTRDKAIELIKENFTDRDLMVELKGSDLVYQAVLKTVQQALNIDLVSKTFIAGAVVEITGWIHGHEFELGEKVTLIEKDGDLWLSRNKDNSEWWINEEESNVC